VLRALVKFSSGDESELGVTGRYLQSLARYNNSIPPLMAVLSYLHSTTPPSIVGYGSPLIALLKETALRP